MLFSVSAKKLISLSGSHAEGGRQDQTTLQLRFLWNERVEKERFGFFLTTSYSASFSTSGPGHFKEDLVNSLWLSLFLSFNGDDTGTTILQQMNNIPNTFELKCCSKSITGDPLCYGCYATKHLTIMLRIVLLACLCGPWRLRSGIWAAQLLGMKLLITVSLKQSDTVAH